MDDGFRVYERYDFTVSPVGQLPSVGAAANKTTIVNTGCGKSGTFLSDSLAQWCRQPGPVA